ncbi:unnamed protein product [Hymenolepis diminuta]|uniref:Uncharacterized protein n=1 Tax=Hymenolepis diminuta TaxID=6216 RepID=A0A564Y0R1_HYMDI|nr:unnamed protein product [Hymenolepis diminuta]
MLNEKVVIQVALRIHIQFYSGHPEINRMEGLARGYTYRLRKDRHRMLIKSYLKCWNAA